MSMADDPLKITTVSFGYLPDALGGAEIYAHRLGVKLVSMGHSVRVFTAVADKAEERQYQVDGIPVTALHVRSRPPYGKLTYTYNPGTARRDLGTGDIAHVHNFGAFSPLLFKNLKRRARYRGVAWTAHDYQMMCPRQILIRKDGLLCYGPEDEACRECKTFKDKIKDGVSSKNFIPNVDAFIAPSAFMLSVFEKAGLPKERCHHVYNGIDLDEFQASPVPAEPRIMFLGQILPHKGLMSLVEAMPRVVEEVPDAVLMVIGKGEQQDQVRARVKELGVEGAVDFKGYVDDVKVYYRKAKVVALPSTWHENCSLVLLEGHALGRPLVATRMGGNPEIVSDGETGYLYEAGDSAEMAEKLVKVLASDDHARAMGVAARQRAEEMFSMDVASRRNLEVYRSIL
jgi:glycosyltransferase involved in cell wall biosynthesis